jgi:hypothetical protein
VSRSSPQRYIASDGIARYRHLESFQPRPVRAPTLDKPVVRAPTCRGSGTAATLAGAPTARADAADVAPSGRPIVRLAAGRPPPTTAETAPRHVDKGFAVRQTVPRDPVSIRAPSCETAFERLRVVTLETAVSARREGGARGHRELVPPRLPVFGRRGRSQLTAACNFGWA